MTRAYAGLRSQSRKESEVCGWSRIPNNTGSRSWIFLSDSDFGCPIGSFFYITLLNGNSCSNGTISFETFIEADISCGAPRFPLIFTAKFHSLYVKESESEILERSDILPQTPQPCLREGGIRSTSCTDPSWDARG